MAGPEPLLHTDSAPAIVVSPNSSGSPTQITPENTSLTFSSANGNAIIIGSGWESMCNSSPAMARSHWRKKRLSFSIGNGTNDSNMKFGASVSAMNAALNGLIYYAQPRDIPGLCRRFR